MELNHVKMRNDDCLIRIEEVFVALVCYLSHSSGGRREPYALAVNWVLFHSSRWGVLCDENGWLRLKKSTVQHSVRCGARAWSSWLLVLDMLMMIDGHDPPFRAWLDNFCGSSTLHPPLGASSSTLSWKCRKWNKGWCGDGVGEDSIWKCVTKTFLNYLKTQMLKCIYYFYVIIFIRISINLWLPRFSLPHTHTIKPGFLWSLKVIWLKLLPAISKKMILFI